MNTPEKASDKKTDETAFEIFILERALVRARDTLVYFSQRGNVRAKAKAELLRAANRARRELDAARRRVANNAGKARKDPNPARDE